MEVCMGYIIAAIIILYILYALIVYVIAPLSGFLLVASLVVGVGYAFIVSIRPTLKSPEIYRGTAEQPESQKGTKGFD